MQRQPGNTTVRRKNVSGHILIAEATEATGTILAIQMQDVTTTSMEIKRSKLEVQLQLFME